MASFGHQSRISLVAAAPSSAAAAFTSLVAVPAKHRAIAAWFKRYSRWLAAAGADHRCSMGWSRTITGASPTLFALLCLTARLAALGGRITAFLEERLIRSGERKILSTITARKLNIAGHGSPCPRLYIFVAKTCIRILFITAKLISHSMDLTDSQTPSGTRYSYQNRKELSIFRLKAATNDLANSGIRSRVHPSRPRRRKTPVS